MTLPTALTDLLYFALAVLGTGVSAWCAALITLAFLDGLISLSRLLKGGDS